MKTIQTLLLILTLSVSAFAEKISMAGFLNAGSEALKKPGFFYQDGDIRFFDSDKKILLGFSGFSNSVRPAAVYYTDSNRLERREKTVPINEYFTAHPELLINKTVKGLMLNANYTFTIKKLTHFDDRGGTAALLVQNIERNNSFNLLWKRYIIVNWDLKKNIITSAFTLSDGPLTVPSPVNSDIRRKNAEYTVSTVKETFYDGDSKSAYLCVTGLSGKFDSTGTPQNEKNRFFKILESSSNGIREVISYKVSGNEPARFYYDSLTYSVLAVVYTERGKSGLAYMADLKTGEVKTIQTPLLTYHAVFDPDRTRIYMLSNKTGKILVYNRRTGKNMQDYHAGSKGFRFGFVQKNTLVFFNDSGIKIISTAGRLRTISSVPSSKYIKGRKPGLWPQGGLVKEGDIYIGWNKIIYHVRYR